MKTIKTLTLLLIGQLCYGQVELDTSISGDFLVPSRDSISMLGFHSGDSHRIESRSTITIQGKSNRLVLDFSQDTLKVSGDMPYNEAAKIFLNSLGVEATRKRDSLIRELDNCLLTNDILTKDVKELPRTPPDTSTKQE